MSELAEPVENTQKMKAEKMIKRYAEIYPDTSNMEERNDIGEWVRYESYEALEKEVAALKADNDKLGKQCAGLAEAALNNGKELLLFESTLRCIAEPWRQHKFTPEQLAKHALRMEPLQP